MKATVFNPVVRAAVKAAADPSRARHGFEQLAASGEGPALAALASDHAGILAALFSGSQAMTTLLLRTPEWIRTVLAPGNLAYPRQEQGLRREVNTALEPARPAADYAGALTRLRQFRQREMLRIAARDLARLANTPEIIREISNVADVCLDATLRICSAQLVGRLGQPWHQNAAGEWQPTRFAVLGLGKLGGQELNYSSDVDVIFVYSEEGHVFKEPPGRKANVERAMASHQFFKRLAESFVTEVSRATADGALFRIDLRLRPEGDAGPLARGLSSYENYYAQWGQTWERMMLIKARPVAGDTALAAEFLEMVQPFRHPRSLGESALREIAAMKVRIENEVVRAGELDRNVKLGRGGIREIEFVVQTVQLLHGGRIPFLQGAQTLPALEKLAQYKFLSVAEARDLAAAYCFLRDIEHRVQMENNLQTHTIPADALARARLAALMGLATPSAFDQTLQRHTRRVREIYERFVKVDTNESPSPFPRQFRGAETEWKSILAGHAFKDVEKSLRLLNEFADGPGYVHVSQRTTDLAMQLLPRLLTLCPRSTDSSLLTPHSSHPPRPVLSDPDRVLARLDSFITAYGARAVLFETWTSHPQLFELLLLLFDRSEFLAEIAIRTPDLVDELVLSGRLGRSKPAAEILKDLRHGRADPDQRLWLRRYHQAEFMRIGLRSILGLVDCEQNFVELTALADACLQYALEAVLRRHKLKTTPMAIVGLGKLGGGELNYGSDLDVLFVAGDKTRKILPRLQKLAVDVMDLLGSQTELGIAFVMDARLRPDGEKGLLVNTLAAYEEYYLRRAQLWEIQALTRTRPIAGDAELGGEFQKLAGALTNFPGFAGAKTGVRPRCPACFTPDWKQEIARMRRRIETERTPPGQDALAFKTGRGGLMDAEFIAQTACLEHGWQEAGTLRAIERVRAGGILPGADADGLLESYRQLRRLEHVLRRWSFEGEAVLPVDPAPYYRVAVRCGYASADEFRVALTGWRRAIRNAYEKVLQ